jgi:hypothetical protein
MSIAHQRLANQHLLDPEFVTPSEVVSYFGAVQAQDYAMAKWSLGLRLQDATDSLIEQAFNEQQAKASIRKLLDVADVFTLATTAPSASGTELSNTWSKQALR